MKLMLTPGQETSASMLPVGEDGRVCFWNCTTLEEYERLMRSYVTDKQSMPWRFVENYSVHGVSDIDGLSIATRHASPQDFANLFAFLLPRPGMPGPEFQVNLDWTYLVEESRVRARHDFDLKLFQVLGGGAGATGGPWALLRVQTRTKRQAQADMDADLSMGGADFEGEDDGDVNGMPDGEQVQARFWGEPFLRRNGEFRVLMCRTMQRFGCYRGFAWASQPGEALKSFTLNAKESQYFIQALQLVLPVVLARRTIGKDGKCSFNQRQFHQQIVSVESTLESFMPKRNLFDAMGIVESLTGGPECAMKAGSGMRLTIDMGNSFNYYF